MTTVFINIINSWAFALTISPPQMLSGHFVNHPNDSSKAILIGGENTTMQLVGIFLVVVACKCVVIWLSKNKLPLCSKNCCLPLLNISTLPLPPVSMKSMWCISNLSQALQNGPNYKQLTRQLQSSSYLVSSNWGWRCGLFVPNNQLDLALLLAAGIFIFYCPLWILMLELFIIINPQVIYLATSVEFYSTKVKAQLIPQGSILKVALLWSWRLWRIWRDNPACWSWTHQPGPGAACLVGLDRSYIKRRNGHLWAS